MTPTHISSPETTDGVLRRVSDRTWAGTLHGYRFEVFECGRGWCHEVVNSHGHAEVCPRVALFAEGARLTRKWMERHRASSLRMPPKWRPPRRHARAVRRWHQSSTGDEDPEIIVCGVSEDIPIDSPTGRRLADAFDRLIESAEAVLRILNDDEEDYDDA
jgi:hypothetical protein